MDVGRPTHLYTASGRGIGSDLPVDPRSLEGHPKEIYQEVVVLYNVDDVDIDLLYNDGFEKKQAKM